MDKNIENMAGNEKQVEQNRGFLRNRKMRVFSLMMLCMSLLSISAFAADGAGDTLVDTITVTSLLTETGVFTKTGIGIIWSLIISNPILEAMVGVGLLSLIFVVFRKIKRAAHF